MINDEEIANQRAKQRQEKFELLAQTAATSLMGKLLRKFWHPVALSADVVEGKARALRILSEDLVIYRGKSGSVHLLEGRCPHRRTLLHTGWVEEDNIRCMYHGWQFSGTGQCLHRPAERDAKGSNIKIASYPTREYGGLVFAYMGAGEPPAFDLPCKEAFDDSKTLKFVRSETWACNWVQHIENSLDPVHVSFAHQMGRVGVFGEAVTAEVPDLKYEETTSGILQIAIRSGERARVSDWTFPNYNHVLIPGLAPDQPWIDAGHWMVANDDHTTTRFGLFAVKSSTPEADAKLKDYFARSGPYQAADHHADLFNNTYPSDPLIELTSAQDYVALMGQGAIADRANELLGASDLGVARIRSILWREMEEIHQGRSGKHWHRTQAVELTHGGQDTVHQAS